MQLTNWIPESEWHLVNPSFLNISVQWYENNQNNCARHFTCVHFSTMLLGVRAAWGAAAKALNGSEEGLPVDLFHSWLDSHALMQVLVQGMHLHFTWNTSESQKLFMEQGSIGLSFVAIKLHFVYVPAGAGSSSLELTFSWIQAWWISAMGTLVEATQRFECLGRTVSMASHWRNLSGWHWYPHAKQAYQFWSWTTWNAGHSSSSCGSICHGSTGFRDTRSIGPTSAQ